MGCQTYRYDTKRDGSLKVPPPTEHLKAVLLAQQYQENTDTVLNQHDESSPPSTPEPDDNDEESCDPWKTPTPDPKKAPKEPSTFDKILAMDDTSSSTSSSPCPRVLDANQKSDIVSPLSVDECSLESMNTLIKIQVGSNTVYIGDSFVHQKTVYEIHGIFPPPLSRRHFMFSVTKRIIRSLSRDRHQLVAMLSCYKASTTLDRSTTRFFQHISVAQWLVTYSVGP